MSDALSLEDRRCAHQAIRIDGGDGGAFVAVDLNCGTNDGLGKFGGLLKSGCIWKWVGLIGIEQEGTEGREEEFQNLCCLCSLLFKK